MTFKVTKILKLGFVKDILGKMQSKKLQIRRKYL